MKIKTYVFIADATAAIIGGVASYFFFCPLVPIAFSGLGLVSVVIVSALFTFYVFRKNVAPMAGKYELPNKNVLLPLYFFEAVTVFGFTFFALILTFFGFIFWKYLIVPHLPGIKFFHPWF
jgi:hypothetical protein